MQCAACSHANPSGAKFCQECGASLKRVCEGCQAQLPLAAKFCHECGRRISGGVVASPPVNAAATDPQSMAGGRYRIQRFLGEGAKKRVYLARDERLEREVALALIKAEGLDEAGRVRVRREAQAMARLGDHPNIVTVHDIGEEEGQLYIVSQYMSGGDLEGTLDASGEQRRLPLEDAVRVAGELCGALDYAHSRGVVHRDVKPGNIWLTEDGTAKLGDFGLAVAVDRSRLTQEGLMVGTVAYMSPEQALGRAPSASTDLYALGATLYEMLTGRPPFLGDDAVAIISQHINTRPVAPSWHRGDIPQRLEALVLELLEKDPTGRPADAARAKQRLDGAVAISTDRSPAAEPADANPLDRLASGVFVGRDEQLETLRRGLDDTLSGRGRVLLLVGEPGIGKTRTSEELATYASIRGAQVLWGRCYEGDGAPAYWPWVQIVRAFAQERDPKVLMSEMGPGAAQIAEVVSEVRERLPGLPTPPKLDPDQARFRLFDSITTFLKNASNQQPLVLVLDDLHWADRPSLLLMEFLTREIDASRILLLGTYRDVDVGRQHPLEQTLAGLARVQSVERVLLRGLREEDVARFVELTSGHTPPPVLVEAVYRETEGNPFFVHEVVRLLQADGRLDHPERVESWSVEIPQGVRQVVGRRLDALGADCNRVLTTASAIGRDFELRVLARVAEVDEDALLEWIEEAEDARVIGGVEGSPGWFRFSHALVRETLYEELRTTRRVRLHRRIAEVLEERYAGNLEGHLSELAYHYCEAATGGDVEKAVSYAERAARRAADALAFEDAASQFERALGALEASEPVDPLQRCRLLLSRAEALFRAGQADESTRAFREGIDLARRLEDPGYLGIAAIGAMRLVISPGSADPEEIGVLEEALERLGEDGPPLLRARLLSRLAGRYVWSDDPEHGREAALRSLALEQQGDAPPELRLEARVEGSVAEVIAYGTGQTRERIARARELIELAVKVGNRTAEFNARGTLHLYSWQLGDRPGALRELAEYRRLADELQQPFFEFMAHRAEAFQALDEGRLEDARRHSWQCRLAGLRVTPETAEVTFGSALYVLRRLQGRFGETEDTLRAGVARYPGAPVWRSLLGCMLAETGRLGEAEEILERAAAEDYASLRNDLLSADESFGLLGDVCVAIGRKDLAYRLYELLEPSQDRRLYIGSTMGLGTAARVLGNLACLLGRFDEFEAHFERGIAIETGFGARGWLPRTQCDYATALLARDAPGDRRRALALLDEAMKTSQELGLRGWLDRGLGVKLAAQGVDSGSTQGTIDAIASSIGSRPLDLSAHSSPDGTVTLMFSDMEGFTAMTERLGDLRAREVVRAHNAIVREQLAAHGGQEVELQGDGFLLAFSSARRGVLCAIAIQRAFDAYSVSHPDEPIRVRIGLHTGEALRERDKFFGRAVIMAARIAAQASGGEILVSSLLKQLTESTGDLHFGAGQSAHLKGISDAQQLFPVAWQ